MLLSKQSSIAQNLLCNANFDTTEAFDCWQKEKTFRAGYKDSPCARSSSPAVHLYTGNPPLDTLISIYQDIPINAGKKYHAGGFLAFEDANWIEKSRATLEVSFLNLNNQELEGTLIQKKFCPKEVSSLSCQSYSNWKMLQLHTESAPSKAQYLRFRITLVKPIGHYRQSTINLDDYFVYEMKEKDWNINGHLDYRTIASDTILLCANVHSTIELALDDFSINSSNKTFPIPEKRIKIRKNGPVKYEYYLEERVPFEVSNFQFLLEVKDKVFKKAAIIQKKASSKSLLICNGGTI